MPDDAPPAAEVPAQPTTSSAATPPRPVIAFFDVDNTLLRGASIYHLGRGARRHGILKLRDLVRFGWHQARFIAVGENSRHLTGVRERALRIVAGISEPQLAEISARVYGRYIAPRLWPETVELTREHLRQGHEVWLITATPLVLAEVIADRLGLTGALGTRIESVDGVFTGRLLGPVLHGARKAEAATALAARLSCDPLECWAYSDSTNDIPLLELVGNRVAVNPDRGLARHALKRGWNILRLRPESIRRARREARRRGGNKKCQT